MNHDPEILDTTPTGRRIRRRRLHHATELWAAVVTICAAIVVVSGIVLSRTDADQTVPTVVFTAAALLAALTVMAATLVRAKVGSSLGEDELGDPPAIEDDPTLVRDSQGHVVGHRELQPHHATAPTENSGDERNS